jgi:hypothetical protein
MTSAPHDPSNPYLVLCRLVAQLEVTLDQLEQDEIVFLLPTDTAEHALVARYRELRRQLDEFFERDGVGSDAPVSPSASGAQRHPLGPARAPSSPAWVGGRE